MAETLVELVARISADATELKKALGDSEKQTETSSKHMADSIKKIGIAMTAAGAAVIAAMGLMAKSAIDEEINIKRLSITMNNVGVSYDKVKDSLEAVISATQRKTGISDSAQRDILGRLILITQDYDKALGLLPTTLDLAAAGEMDATTAATYLGKAYLDLQAGANEVSVRFGQASIQFKSMEDIQNRVRGSAENLKNPLIGIKNAVSDVSEAIGKNFIPIIKTVTNAIEDIAIKIQDWIRLHPELTKGLTLLTAGVGAVLLVVGSTILILPQIIAGIKSLTIVVGLATAANIAYAASIAGILVGLGMIGYGISYIMAGEEAYNRVKTQGMQLDVQRERYLRGEANNYQELLGRYLPTIEAYIELTKARGADTREMENWVKTAKEGLTALGQQEAATKALIPTEASVTEAIKRLEESYGDLGDAIKSRGDQARDTANRVKQALDDELSAAQRNYSAQTGWLTSLHNQAMKNLNETTSKEVKALQDKIDALDKSTSDEQRSLQTIEDEKRRVDLYNKLQDAKRKGDTKSITAAQIAYNEHLANVQRQLLLQTREDEKQKLRDQINDVRDNAQKQADVYTKDYEAAIAAEKKKLDAVENRIAKSKPLIDDALDYALKGLKVELKNEKEELLKGVGDFGQTLLDKEDKQRESYTRLREQALAYSNFLGGLFGGVISAPTGTPPPGTSYGPYNPADYGLSKGGIVTQPTMALIGEAGPEAVVPLSGGIMGGVTINFTQPVFFDREDTMNRFVDLVRKGIQRQDRLRFGGAWDGR